MATYDEMKAELADESLQAPDLGQLANDSVSQTPSYCKTGVPGWIYVVLAMVLIFGIYFGLPAFVDSRQPSKSKLENRVAAVEWFLDLIGESPEKKPSDNRGPLDSAFE